VTFDSRPVRFVCTGLGRGGHSRWAYDAVRLHGEHEVEFVVPSRTSGTGYRGMQDRPGAPMFDIKCTHPRCGRNPRLQNAAMVQAVTAILAAYPGVSTVEFDISGPGSAILYKPASQS
jgi:hypothetical protein